MTALLKTKYISPEQYLAIDDIYNKVDFEETSE